MFCSLEVSSASSQTSTKLRNDNVGEILYSHLSIPAGLKKTFNKVSNGALSIECEEEPLASFQLQAVQEETEELEDDGPEYAAEKRDAKKTRDKPSKRSRVQ
jgi:hypothetical protein